MYYLKVFNPNIYQTYEVWSYCKEKITDSSITLNLPAPTASCTCHKCTNMTLNVHLIYYKLARISIYYHFQNFFFQFSFKLENAFFLFFNGTNSNIFSPKAMLPSLQSCVCVSVCLCVPQILPCIQVEQASPSLHPWAKYSSSAVVRNKGSEADSGCSLPQKKYFCGS